MPLSSEFQQRLAVVVVVVSESSMRESGVEARRLQHSRLNAHLYVAACDIHPSVESVEP